MEKLQLKVDILRQKAELLKEGVPQDKIDRALPVPDTQMIVKHTFSLV